MYLKLQIAQRISVPCNDVKNVIIWGNHSSTQFPDVAHAVVGADNKPAADCVQNEAWLKNEFVSVCMLYLVR